MKWLIVATAGSGLWLAALPANASASDSLEQIYKSCRVSCEELELAKARRNGAST
jgi:hypothetical protein